MTENTHYVLGTLIGLFSVLMLGRFIMLFRGSCITSSLQGLVIPNLSQDYKSTSPYHHFLVKPTKSIPVVEIS
jgi:hypothetical protein